jgi:hypothetical protein
MEMEWDDFFDYNKYDEVAARDIQGVAEAIEQFVQRRGASLDMKVVKLTRAIIHYCILRQNSLAHEISDPQRKIVKPRGWTARHERLWQEWVQFTFDLDEWDREVIQPIFGSDERYWECCMGDWRNEIFSFLPFWIQRSIAIVEDYDPCPPEESVDSSKEVDPYILENYGRRR